MVMVFNATFNNISVISQQSDGPQREYVCPHNPVAIKAVL